MSSNSTIVNSSASHHDSPHIDTRDFDPADLHRDHASQPLLQSAADQIAARARARLRHDFARLASFAWGLLAALCAGGITTFSVYAPFFLRDLRYSQYNVNSVAIVAEVAMYLLVPVLGYLCDRYTPRPIAGVAAVCFGVGYAGAAVVYRAGGDIAFAWMLVAFAFVGMGTCAMYLAAVTTCAKNFGTGRHKGLMLALPISAFGVSGMWQAQVGSHFLTRPVKSALGGRELDPGKYFTFLGILLTVIGVIGTMAAQIVDQEDLIDEAVEDLERSGLTVPSRRPSACVESAADAAYGTFDSTPERSSSKHAPTDDAPHHPTAAEELAKKTWLLNYETSLFLRDETMWMLAIGFLLVTGPSEAYINNVGTIIDTLTPAPHSNHSSPGPASTHVSIIAVSSTIARLAVGTASDLFAPSPAHPHPQRSRPASVRPASRPCFSRMYLLLPSLCVFLSGYLILAAPPLLARPPLLQLATAVIGAGYGASFALVPIIIAVVWGIENFGTNWGIVAMFPAAGAAFWGLAYSWVYDWAVRHGGDGRGGGAGVCVGWACYGAWAVGSAVSVAVAIGFCGLAWWRWNKRGIIV